MPYVPSKKTDGKSTDREIINVGVEKVALKAAKAITTNKSLVEVYRKIVVEVSENLSTLLKGADVADRRAPEFYLAYQIFSAGEKYGYDGAYLGEYNYAFTRFIQRVPQIKVELGHWEKKDEIRYWLYGRGVRALLKAATHVEHLDIDVDGILVDIKDEYKRRVNTAYEAAQIIKSGDCYDTPYYTRLVEVVDENGSPIGHMEVMLARSEKTLHLDVLEHQLVLKKK